MTPREDDPELDRAWRDIVENYGERPSLAGATAADESPHNVEEPVAPPSPPRNLFEPVPGLDIFAPDWDGDEDFVPPVAPEMPTPELPRLVAWAGVTLVPVLILALALLQITPPRLLAYGCLIWAIGGFAYLVFTMPREPREPWDNGARV